MKKITILILLFGSINIFGQDLNYSVDTIQFKSLDPKIWGKYASGRRN